VVVRASALVLVPVDWRSSYIRHLIGPYLQDIDIVPILFYFYCTIKGVVGGPYPYIRVNNPNNQATP